MLNENFVGIIIVTWNKEKYVLKLLESLSELNYTNYEINVVDNASSDETVKKIKELFPNINLIENNKNLGGTGGFNTGMRYVLSNKNYDYIWLLDNDAIVEPNTLNGLTKTIKTDSSIGVVGSLICHPEDTDTVVELGGMVNWNSGVWDTCHKNEKKSQLKENVKDVDYVAACSMLIKPTVLKKTGVFDEKMFVHWDDIEFCLRAKRNGFRIVATTNSVIYHYNEKKAPIVFLYYDLRNVFLTMSYHLKGIKKGLSFYRQLRRLMKRIALAKIFDEGNIYQVMKAALDDFINLRFYQFSYHLDDNGLNKKLPQEISPSFESFIILPYGTIFDLIECAKTIKSYSKDNKVAIFIQKERVSLIKDQNCFDRILPFENIGGISAHVTVQLVKLFNYKYDVGVIPTTEDILPLYAIPFKENMIFNQEDKSFYLSRYDRTFFWKIAYAFIIGEIQSIYNLPKIIKSSKKLQSNAPDL